MEKLKLKAAELKEKFLKAKKGWKIAGIVLLIAIILLVSYLVFNQVQKIRARRAIEKINGDLEGGASGSGGSQGADASNDNWPLTITSKGENVRALQNLLNKLNPANKLVVDGVMGVKTKAALISAGGSLPLSAQAFANLAAKAPRSMGEGSDDLPLQKGSKGEKVTALQNLIVKIAPQSKLAVTGNFDDATYKALITYIGTKYYPVTLQNLLSIADIAKKGETHSANYFGWARTIDIRPGIKPNINPSEIKIGGRNCTKQWDSARQEWIWNCGGGYIYDTHGQPI